MLVSLSRHGLLEPLKIVLQQLQYVFHDIDDVLRFNDEKTFTRALVRDLIEVNNYTKVKTFVDEKGGHADSEKHLVVISEFGHEQPFESIILHVIAILAKMRFDFLISTFTLIIDL